MAFSRKSTTIGAVTDAVFEHRFPVYAACVATLFIVDGLFTTPSNRVPEGVVSLLVWFVYSTLLLRAFIRLRGEDDLSPGGGQQPAHLLASMIVVLVGWWSIELLSTEVLFGYGYTIPTECTGACYRMMPLFVPPGHWILYDLGNMAAERYAETRHRLSLSGVYVSTANMLSAIRRGLPRSMEYGSSGISASAPLLQEAALESSQDGSSRTEDEKRSDKPWCIEALFHLVVIVPALYDAIVTQTSTVEVVVLLPLFVQAFLLVVIVRGEMSSWEFATESLVKLYGMLLFEICGCYLLRVWRWHSAWPVTCDAVMTDRGMKRLEHEQPPIPSWWFCIEGQAEAGDAGLSFPDAVEGFFQIVWTLSVQRAILTFQNPPWLIGAAYLAIQIVWKVLSRRLAKIISRPPS